MLRALSTTFEKEKYLSLRKYSSRLDDIVLGGWTRAESGHRPYPRRPKSVTESGTFGRFHSGLTIWCGLTYLTTAAARLQQRLKLLRRIPREFIF